MAPFEGRGVLSCRCVIFDHRDVLFVSHAGGDWQMYCSDRNHDFSSDEDMAAELAVVHPHHLVERDPTLLEVADLPVDQGAERDVLGAPWRRFDDADDD